LEPATTTLTPPPPPPRTARVGAFAAHLARLVDTEDRAALAALRRGLGKAPGDVAAMHPLIVPFLPDDGNPRDDASWYLVGSLFGLHPEPWRGDARNNERGPSFGATLKRLRPQKVDDREPVIDRRMVAILNAHRDDVGTHLRQAVGLLRGGGIAVDWAQLLRDLLRWDHPERPAQRQWARDYYRGASGAPGTPDAANG
jgi:CRISPR system Cascade subunit CasB